MTGYAQVDRALGKVLIGLFLTLNGLGFAQEAGMDWSNAYKLTLADFQNPRTEINDSLSAVIIQSGATIEMGFQMNKLSFMFTKHFNDKIGCKFYRQSAILMAPDSLAAKRLLKLARYDFDLSELYARKIRKELFENKKTFSKSNFFEPYFNRMVQEKNTVSGRVYKATNFGNRPEVLEKEHQLILEEIDQLANFCKSCKPPKRKKK